MTENAAHKAIPENMPKHICIMQLTRIGDIIQTIQVAKYLKESRPEIKTSLIARSRFASPLTFLINKYFDAVFFIDSNVFDCSPQSNNKLSLPLIQENLQNTIKKINSQKTDVLINLSFSKTSGWLSSLVHSTHKLGLVYNKLGEIKIHDHWSKFVFSNVMGGPLNPFSLIDIYKNIVGIKGIERKPKKPTSKEVQTIILHPFASHAKKSWKASKWVEIIFKTLKDNENATIKIVGSKSEINASNEIINHPLLDNIKNRFINLVGKTTIEELYHQLQSSDLFVGHDSMVGHLAAMAQVQTLTISLGTVRPIETSPYGENNYNIMPRTKCFPCFPGDKCPYYQCHADIPYKIVNSSINSLLTSRAISFDEIKKNNSSFHIDSISIKKSYFTNIDFLAFKEITPHNLSFQEILSKFYRIIWLYTLIEKDEENDFPQLTRGTHQELLRYLEGMQPLFELAEFGQKYSRYILEEIASSTPNLNKIKNYSKKIDEIDSLQKIIKETYPGLSPIIDYFTVVKGNIPGENIVDLTENSFITYNGYSTVIAATYELFEKTIAQHLHKSSKKQSSDIRI